MGKKADERKLSRHKRRAKRHQKRPFVSCGFLIVLIAAAGLLWNRQLPARDTNSLLEPPLLIESSANAKPDEMSGGTAKEVLDEAEWSLILVNKRNPIPAGYDVELKRLRNGESVDIRIYPALQKMSDAARADGVYPVVASGYRTTEKQQKIMSEKIAVYEAEGYSPAKAQKEAEAWVALPGTSEHQLGIAVDINADGIHSSGNEVYGWLKKNAYRFGFICRYPPDKTVLTGVSNEPWHYRYVGIGAATEMYEQNLCLEEYLNTQD